MTQLNVEFAGVPLQADIAFTGIARRFRAFLTDREPEFRVEVPPEQYDVEEYRMRKANGLGDDPNIRIPRATLEYTALHRLISEELLSRDILMFHASALAFEGRAYLFTAPSGTGKSTHAAYWRQVYGDRAAMINDDKPFLRFEPDGTVLACGSAWQGKHDLGNNIRVPVQAVCLLSRGQKDRIVPVSPREAMPALFRQCFHSESPEGELRVLEMLDRLCAGVQLYKMECTMSPEAAKAAREAMVPGER